MSVRNRGPEVINAFQDIFQCLEPWFPMVSQSSTRYSTVASSAQLVASNWLVVAKMHLEYNEAGALFSGDLADLDDFIRMRRPAKDIISFLGRTDRRARKAQVKAWEALQGLIRIEKQITKEWRLYWVMYGVSTGIELEVTSPGSNEVFAGMTS
ncbi:hypothetical protein D9758_016222 [Tetrapyrgos nigripes]|uniref:Uncharacterized protein n=1 Tax=Tetrapyrgos nigripes TaxID=182062 RepID=A0A8H5CL92_9AGAR|nr:hypothetical protein D9758_016222 [Tetrapyrgos nigripes]